MVISQTVVTLHTTLGDIKIELDTEKAPITTENFINYVKEGFYNDTIFHRVIDNFMIQGGGLMAGMQEKATNAAIQNEANNGLSNKRGTIAMARTQNPHSATAQFFINVQDNDFLDFKSETTQGWGYCVFGKVIDGLEVVDHIRAVKTGNVNYYENVPVDDILIKSTSIEVTTKE